MEWLASLKWQWVIVIVIVLVAIRLLLGKSKSRLGKQVAETAESLAIAFGLVFLIIRPFVVQAFFIPSSSMEPTLMGHRDPRPQFDHILVNKFIYRFTDPKHGDIIVFKAPPNASDDGKEKDFIKRVMGLPGDEIEVVPGYVLVGDIKYRHEDLRALLGTGLTFSVEGAKVKLTRDRLYIDGTEVSKKELASAADVLDVEVEIHPGAVIRNGKKLNEPYVAEDPDTGYGPERIEKDKLFMMGDNRNFSRDSRSWGQLERDRVLGKAMFIFWPLNRIRLVD